MIKRVLAVCCMALSIVLMALPYGVAISYWYSGPPDFETVTSYYSYFSMMPVGASGNIFPLTTVVISLMILVRLLISLGSYISKKVKKDDIGKPTFVLLIICVLTSVLSWSLFNAISIIGVIIMLLHVATYILLIMILRIKPDAVYVLSDDVEGDI